MGRHVDGNPALAQWAAAGLHEVTLPSLTRVKVRVPATEALVRDKALPADLRRVALRFTSATVTPGDMDDETLEAFMTLTQTLGARCIRAVWNTASEEWDEVELTVDQLAEWGLPAEDLAMIEAIALRRRTPAQVTAISLSQHGQLGAAELRRVIEAEAGGTVDAFAPFRGQPGRAGGGADGSPVRPATEPDAGDSRPGAGVGTG